MLNTFSSVKIGPSFIGVVKYLAIAMVTVIGALILLDIVLEKDPIANMIEHWSNEESIAIGVFVIVFFVVVLGISALGNMTAVSISTDQMSGRTESGKKVTFAVDSVEKVEYRYNLYAPGLIISSKQSEQKLFMLTIGMDREETLEKLQTAIGRSHILTRWFEEDAT